MRISVTASLCLALGLIHPVRMSFSDPPGDLSGSEYDMDSSGSGSGDWPEQDETKNITGHSNSKDGRIFAVTAGGRTKKSSHRSSVLNLHKTHWLSKDSRSGFIVVGNSKSLLERQGISDAVIAGGVTGGIIAAALAAILIYKWQKKDDGGYTLGQQRASDEDYHKTNREEVA